VSETGMFGPLTANSIAKIQELEGINISGAVESATHSAIRSRSYDAISTVNSKMRQYPGFVLKTGDSDRKLQNDNKTITTPVNNVQQMLRRISSSEEIPIIIPDGIFGADTEEAVIILQNKGGFDSSGIVDYETWEYIVLLDRENREIVRENKGVVPKEDDAIKIAEIMLERISDSFGNAADERITVEEIQEASGLPQTGIIDKNTWNGIVGLYESIDI